MHDYSVNVRVYSYICMYVGIYVCVCTCSVYVCGVHMCMGCIPVRVYNCMGVSSCVWMSVIVISDAFVQSGPVTGDSELCSL